MSGSAHDSDRMLAEANRTLNHQRAGGRRVEAIGAGSARLRAKNWAAKIKRVLIALAVIVVGAMGAGLFLGALGFEGLFLTVILAIVAVFVLLRYPRIEVPTRENIARSDLNQTIARTELWLEAQRPALPAPAVPLIEHIGAQLDGLGVQLQGIDEKTPAAGQVRTLVAEHLPEIISSYTAIPSHLREEKRIGSTPDAQLTEGLSRISAEIDDVTRQLAEGAMDDLAVRSRYLDTRYGGTQESLSDQTIDPARLNPPSADDTRTPKD